MRSRFLAALAVVVIAASPVESQSLHYDAVCGDGAFRGCASVALWNELDPVTGHFYLFLRFV